MSERDVILVERILEASTYTDFDGKNLNKLREKYGRDYEEFIADSWFNNKSNDKNIKR